MPDAPHNVLLPMLAPDTEALRRAVAAIISDLQRKHDLSDEDLALKLDVHKNTICNARNRKSDLGALTIAKIGAKFGADAVAPYHALYGASAHGVAASDAAPLSEVADALAALTRSAGLKARLDALPVVKNAAEKLVSYVVALERMRIAA
jgi:hypothetical protein